LLSVQRLVGNMLYVSGSSARPRVIGKVPDEVSFDEAKAAARSTGISLLSIAKGAIGSLDGIKRVVKSLGMVNARPDFGEHPGVIDGYAELMTEVFGEDGWGARSAVGMGSLPMSIAVEIEAIFEVRLLIVAARVLDEPSVITVICSSCLSRQVEDGYGEPSDAPGNSSGEGSTLELLLAKSEERVVALESRVEELESFIDNMVEEEETRFEVIKAKL
jgi:enamine deaminase RidA (YjgF/YER057c/UK114 family)